MKVKQALAKLKQEVTQMDIRTGVMQHVLLQVRRACVRVRACVCVCGSGVCVCVCVCVRELGASVCGSERRDRKKRKLDR